MPPTFRATKPIARLYSFINRPNERAHVLIAFAGIDHAVDQRRQKLIDDFHPLLGERDRILAQVEAVRQRIGIAVAGVFVGGVIQARLGAARGDLRQFGDFALRAAGQRLVAVFDGPIVVRAEHEIEVIALLLPFGTRFSGR